MKIARITGVIHPQSVGAIYGQQPSLSSESYASQRRVLQSAGLDQLFGYEKYFRRHKWQAQDFVFDAESMQFAWAKEYSAGLDLDMLYTDKKSLLLQILIAQLKEFSPDVLLVHNPRLFEGGTWQYIQEQLPGVRWITAFLTAQLSTPMQLLGVDSVLCCIPPFLADEYSGNIPKELMYYCFDARPVLQQKKSLFSFFGATGTCPSMHHRDRYHTLAVLLAATPISIFGLEMGRKATSDVSDRVTCILSELNDLLIKGDLTAIERYFYLLSRRHQKWIPELSTLFPERVYPPMMGMDYIHGLKQSLVTINIHSHLTRGYVGNMRTFEATGCGACLMIEEAENLGDIFEADKEVVTYNCNEEAVEKANWLLENPNEANCIAMAGHAKTKSCHGIGQRVEQIVEHIQCMLRRFG